MEGLEEIDLILDECTDEEYRVYAKIGAIRVMRMMLDRADEQLLSELPTEEMH